MRCTWMDTMPRPIKHRPSLDIYIPSTYNIDRPSEAVLQIQTKSPFTGSTFQMSDNLYKKKSLLNMAMLKNFLSKATKKRCSFIVNFPVDREWLHPFYMLTYFTLSGPYQEVVTGGHGTQCPSLFPSWIWIIFSFVYHKKKTWNRIQQGFVCLSFLKY